MEERVHPIPFRTRQLSSPSSMILRILTWESRTTPRLYFQRAVLYRTALCFLPEAHPHRCHPSLSLKPVLRFLPRPASAATPPYAPGPAQALTSVSPPSLGSPPPQRLLPSALCTGSLHNRLTRFLFTFFSQASSICRRRVLDAVSERDASLF